MHRQLDPPRALHILHLPIRAMRVITDPVVDIATFILSRSILPVFYVTLDLLFRLALFGVDKLAGSPTAAAAAELPPLLVCGPLFYHILF